MHGLHFRLSRLALVLLSLLALLFRSLNAQSPSASTFVQFAGASTAFAQSQVTDTIGAKAVGVLGICDYMTIWTAHALFKKSCDRFLHALLLYMCVCVCMHL